MSVGIFDHMMAILNLNNFTCFGLCFGTQNSSEKACQSSTSTEIVKSILQDSILPLGSPSPPSISAVPLDIPVSYVVCKEVLKTSSHDFLSISGGPDQDDSSAFCLIESCEKRSNLVEAPLSLAQLCVRKICVNRANWKFPDDRAEYLAFSFLPAELAQLIFDTSSKFRLLTKHTITAFNRCWITDVNLSCYPKVTGSWLLEIATFRGLRSLNLSHVKTVDDEGFRHLGALGHEHGCLETLSIECCVSLTDKGVAPVISALSRTLRHLNLGGCVQLTDTTLAHIIFAGDLRTLNLNRCQLMTPAYLCQIGFLQKLHSLDLSLIPNVNDSVLSAFRPCSTPSAPYIVKAVKLCNNEKNVSFDNLDSEEIGDNEHDSDSINSSEAISCDDIDDDIGGSRWKFDRLFSKRIWAPRKPPDFMQLSEHASKIDVRKDVLAQPKLAKNNQLRNRAPPGVLVDAADALVHIGVQDANGSPSWPVYHPNVDSPMELLLSRLQTAGIEASGLGHLLHLNVSYCSVSDVGCACISHISSLRTLNLSQNPLTQGALDFLSKLVNLEEVEAAECSGLSAGISKISSLENLRLLNLENIDVSHFDFQRPWINLRVLYLSGCGVNDHLVSLLSKNMPCIEDLYLRNANLSHFGAASLASLRTLKKLDLGDAIMESGSFKHLTALQNLTDLNLFQCHLGSRGVRTVVSKLPRLQRLNLDIAGFEERRLSDLKTLERLVHLDLFGVRLTDSGCTELVLAQLPMLESLYICGGLVSNVGVAHLCRLRNKLTHLKLSNNTSISDEGVIALVDAFGSSLKTLALASTRITNGSVKFFCKFRILEELVIRDCKITIKSIRILRHLAPNIRYLVV